MGGLNRSGRLSRPFLMLLFLIVFTVEAPAALAARRIARADDGYLPAPTTMKPQAQALAKALPPTLEEALDTAGVVWTTGSHPWLPQTEVTHDGMDAALSGPVHNADDFSWLKATNIIGPGSISFRWKAQISGGAFASFRITGGSGVWPQAVGLNASTDWQWETCFFGAGPQELLWVTYGNSDDPSQISVWLDEVIITGPGRETAPFFTTFPTSATVPAGTNLTLKAVASGHPLPALQWRFQGVDLPGATNFTLALTNVQAADVGIYSVVAANSLGTVTNAAGLSVQERVPVILVEPASLTVTFGLSARFDVTAQGTWPISYQWRFNGLNLVDETNTCLVLNPIAANQGGVYSVVVSNPLGSATSAACSLSVVRVAAWGENSFGQCQVPSNVCEIVAVAAGSGHSLALRRNGSVLAWGDSTWSAQSAIPTNLTNVAGIAAGGWHSLALRSNGTVTSWGFNSSSQTNVPADLTGAIAVAGGLRHSLALKADGRVVAWGHEPSAQPAIAAALTSVIAIAAGSLHNLALLSNGTVRAWGDNTGKPCDVPPGLSNVVAISAGAGHSLALRGDGSVVAWGTNQFNQATVPASLTNVAAIRAGDQHNLVLLADGTLQAWGDNRYGQTDVPTGLVGVAAVAGGRAHSVALLGVAPPISEPCLLPGYFPGSTQFQVSMPTVPGRTYFLEAGDSLTNPDWVTLSVLFGDGTTRGFKTPTATAARSFYRVRVEN